jgi:GNAT superfamily N-acetyltransferase
MDAYTLRVARPSDAAAVRDLIEELGYGGIDDADFAAAYRAVLADDTQRVWLALPRAGEEEGRVVGMMSVSCRPQLRLAGPVMTIEEMVVTAAARGTGAGAALLALAKDEVRRLGAGRLELHTARGRPSYERGFYVKNGFREVDSAVMRWEPRTRSV